ncbi:hypothetical protein [Jeotgalibacillus terrae]|uniref:DNA-binding protein n=1 Tax=Jeotgalibacillus terrae TaxID=587735 RepID=A0ABW5ZND2_9BACL|nr:hypothetical protein [Jeotgalibacillus terrae]MBM7581086.1 hypothetical protein [Jeotgalibacillus terrae]
MRVTLDELEAMVLHEHLKEMFQRAYEDGVEEGKRISNLPQLLTNTDLRGIFQVTNATLHKITRRPDFPKFQYIQARYPRDPVLKWIEEHSTTFHKREW